jgi:hypothetical protein
MIMPANDSSFPCDEPEGWRRLSIKACWEHQDLSRTYPTSFLWKPGHQINLHDERTFAPLPGCPISRSLHRFPLILEEHVKKNETLIRRADWNADDLNKEVKGLWWNEAVKASFSCTNGCEAYADFVPPPFAALSTRSAQQARVHCPLYAEDAGSTAR